MRSGVSGSGLGGGWHLLVELLPSRGVLHGCGGGGHWFSVDRSNKNGLLCTGSAHFII